MAQGNAPRPSLLMVEELFNAEDVRFLEALRKFNEGGPLASFVERWKKDPRPWSRAQVLEYVGLPMNCAGHQVIVKRLFKHAEAQKDDELMAAFLTAFDVLVRRVRYNRYHYDWPSRSSWTEERLRTPHNVLIGLVPKHNNLSAAELRKWQNRSSHSRGLSLFTYHTRYYLRRRAWRYFRRMARQRPKDYTKYLAKALVRYREEDFAKGENILDSWALMHACFGAHDAVKFDAVHASLKEGRGLGELDAKPYKADLWSAPEACPLLLKLLPVAGARLVRVWCMQLLRKSHLERLNTIEPAELIPLLDHADPELQQFGASLLQNSSGLQKLSVADWLRLLLTKNLTALELICQSMVKEVTAERVDLGQSLTLANARQAPVARLGLAFLKQKKISTPQERALLAALADTQCAAVSGELAEWALGVLGTTENFDRDAVQRFFDSTHAPARNQAWNWMLREADGKPISPGYSDTLMWARLFETPYDDLRLRMVDLLERRSKLPGAGAAGLEALWCSVLLGVHRGGRQKSKAVRQLGAALALDPAQAERLLPILSVTLRSVRGPERRAALAALVGAIEAQPALGETVRKLVPDLVLDPVEAAR